MAKKFIIVAAVLIIAGIAVYEGVSMFGKNKISGKLMDAVLVPGTSGSPLLLVLTDGSLEYISKSRRPGKTVTGRKGLFCKTYLYLYDPVSRKILKTVKTKYDSIPPDSVLVPIRDKIWEVSVDVSYDRPHLRVLDKASGEVIMTWSQFSSKYPELSAGVTSAIAINQWPPYLEIRTKQGKTFYYSLEAEKLFSDKKSFLASLDRLRKEIVLFKLADPSGGKRRRLFKILGFPSKLCHTSMPESYFSKPELIKRFYGATAEPIAQNQVFLDGWIAYQDSDVAVIVHQDQLGDDSPRRITCISSDGKTMWTIPQDQLLPGLMRRSKDAFSTTEIMKDRLRVKRAGNVLLFVLARKGMMAVNMDQGKVLWMLRP